MKRETITISVPVKMKQYINQRAGSGGGYASVSEYFRALVRQDQSLVYGRMGNQTLYEMRRQAQLASTPGIFSQNPPSRVK